MNVIDPTRVRRARAPRALLAIAGGAIVLGSLAGCTAEIPTVASASETPTPTPTQSGPYTYAYQSDDFGFSAGFPDKPQVADQQQSMLGLTVPVEMVGYTSGDTSAVFAEAIRYPADSFGSNARPVLLESSLTGLATSLGGTVGTKQDVELDGEPALRAEVLSDKAPGDGQYLLTLHGDVEYILFAYGDYADSFDAYLDTFAFTG